jgi:hypothetical protein
VPYRVTFCKPDVKRPFMYEEYGTAVDAEAAEAAILEVIVYHLVEIGLPVECAYDDSKFWNHHDGCMGDAPIKSFHFTENMWVYPTYTVNQYEVAYKKSAREEKKYQAELKNLR